MYHCLEGKSVSFLITCLFAALVWIVSISSIAFSYPVSSDSNRIFQEKLEKNVCDWKLIPRKRELKREPDGVEIYQFDREPIGNRRVLLLVHGLMGEHKEVFRWGKVANYFVENEDFDKNFKIYFARYNSKIALDDVKPHFKQAVLKLCEEAQGKPIHVMALSLGGNIVQDAMTDKETNNAIAYFFSLGTPFHGSPLFARDWMLYSMAKNHSFPWIRYDLCLSYDLYFSRHKNLQKDLKWDNIDNSIPTIGTFKGWIPSIISGDLSPKTTSNPELIDINETLLPSKDKFILYGGYIVSPYIKSGAQSWWMNTARFPVKLVRTNIPFHIGREHPVLRALNHEMGLAITANNDHELLVSHGKTKKKRVRYIFGLNDGITPLASALYLREKHFDPVAITEEGELDEVKQQVDVRKARVFRDVDHLTFIDGYRPIFESKFLKDELHPEDGKQIIFQWMLSDLLDTCKPAKQASSGTEDELSSNIQK
jgi:hypothetical protein